jgi:RHS repeat-associated protein
MHKTAYAQATWIESRINVVNTYDAANRLLTTTDAQNITVTNEYDLSGNRIAIVDGKNQRTEFEYDGLSRNTSQTYGAGGSQEDTTTYLFDDLNKRERIDPKGNHTLYAYDFRNRLKQVTYKDSNGTPVNNATNATRSYTYDKVGNLLSVTEAAKGGKADVAYTYDALKRQQTETSSGITHQYSYDLAGNRLQTIYNHNGANPRAITSTYDSLNRLDTMTESGRTTAYRYDLNGNVAQKLLPNGDSVATTFDALNRRAIIDARNGSDSRLYQFAQRYDIHANLRSIAEDYPDTGSVRADDRTVTNTYDGVNRLLTETLATAAGTQVTTYAYDNAHNRESMTVAGASDASKNGTTTYSYNHLNQLTSASFASLAQTYSYDPNGNRLTHTKAGQTDTYSYDFENRLVALDKNIHGEGINTGDFIYAYDYRTRRVLRDESGAGGAVTRLVFSGGTSVREYEAGALTVEYIRGSDWGGGVGGVLYTIRGGIPSFTHNNGRGDIVAKTDASGSLTYQAAYEAFGTHTAEAGATQDRQKANSKDEDPTGLLNEGFRYRNLETDVFISRDPLGMVDCPNLYTYVNQNPWTHLDADGLSIWTKVLKFTIKGGDVAMTLDGIRQDVQTYCDPNSSPLQKAGAVLSIASEVLPASVGDAKDALRAAEKGLDAVQAAKQTAKAADTAKDTANKLDNVAEANKKADNVSPTKSSRDQTLENNKKVGAEHEQKVGEKVKSEQTDVGSQVTLEADSGTRTKVDFLGKKEGEVKITEAKGSETAPLTPNQKKAFPEIEQSGATVRGKKGGNAFPAGTQIPPTKPEIVRPKDLEPKKN